uniref:Uncharacterized protein n=1 Tax=Anguilla anguilla TaxID=7936 RepID=A0A0E9WCG8_ANGAN
MHAWKLSKRRNKDKFAAPDTWRQLTSVPRAIVFYYAMPTLLPADS